jgi:RNA polymerase sigma factor (sigma-70 family)
MVSRFWQQAWGSFCGQHIALPIVGNSPATPFLKAGTYTKDPLEATEWPVIASLPLTIMTEEQLVSGCLRGDVVAQKELYQSYSRRMMSICMRYASDRDQARDILQDGFVKVFTKMDHFRGDGPLGGWITRTMVNTALDHVRRNKPFSHSVDLTEAEHLHAEKEHVLSAMTTDELMGLIQRLPTGYRTVFNLFAIEGHPHKDIAEMLGISENTSKSQFMKARAYLRKMLPKEAAELYGKDDGKQG